MRCSPVILDKLGGKGRQLTRIESTVGDEKDEAWLQELIFCHPELLPVDEFDDSAGGLIPLGREVGNPAGSIDNLYVTTGGVLTVVETKLWKNPQKHREVVVQIVDYAKELSRWRYDDLDAAVVKSWRAGPTAEARSVQEIVKPRLAEAGMDFTEFQEALLGNIQKGRFLLLIVGDRISPNVALLSQAIHGAPGLEFEFGLVEIQMYPLNPRGDWPLVVVPEVVGHTVEETRAVVKIQYSERKPEVEVAVPAEDKREEGRGKVSVASFLSQLPEDLQPVFERWVDTWTHKGYFLSFGKVGIAFHAIIQGKRTGFFEVYPDTITLRTRKLQQSIGATPEQYEEYLGDLRDVPKALDRLSAGRMNMPVSELTAEEYDAIFRANVSFAEKVGDKP